MRLARSSARKSSFAAISTSSAERDASITWLKPIFTPSCLSARANAIMFGSVPWPRRDENWLTAAATVSGVTSIRSAHQFRRDPEESFQIQLLAFDLLLQMMKILAVLEDASHRFDHGFVVQTFSVQSDQGRGPV